LYDRTGENECANIEHRHPIHGCCVEQIEIEARGTRPSRIVIGVITADGSFFFQIDAATPSARLSPGCLRALAQA